MSVSLADLLDGIRSLPTAFNRAITGLALDSRLVRPGDLFFARAGSQTHGTQFIDDAIRRGAVAIIAAVAPNTTADSLRRDVPVIALPHLTHHLGHIAARFHGNPSRRLTMIGVTGTNGKTSVTHLLAQTLERCAVVGTLGAGLVEQLTPTTHTTPDAVILQGLLAELVAQDIHHVGLEVSSHALDQGRVEGVAFTVAIFTNLSRDHLDYHGDMATYGQAKQRLFHTPGLQYAVINRDDAFGQTLLQNLPEGVVGIGYGLSLNPTDHPTTNHGLSVVGSNLCLAETGMRLQVTTPWGSGCLASPLLGRFNAANLLAVLATLGALGIPFEEALRTLSQAQAVSGRMETLGGGPTTPLVVVDYAHTPDALEQVLLTLRQHTKGRLWCVFGCGGDRDRGKRPIMGAVAERLADTLVLTNDNPRNEEALDILQAILSGIHNPTQVAIIPDRAAAIRHAITSATPRDVVLIAGKGHEQYQQIQSTRLPFSDRLEAEQALKTYLC